jgi:hypothetical protein
MPELCDVVLIRPLGRGLAIRDPQVRRLFRTEVSIQDDYNEYYPKTPQQSI